MEARRAILLTRSRLSARDQVETRTKKLSLMSVQWELEEQSYLQDPGSPRETKLKTETKKAIFDISTFLQVSILEASRAVLLTTSRLSARDQVKQKQKLSSMSVFWKLAEQSYSPLPGSPRQTR